MNLFSILSLFAFIAYIYIGFCTLKLEMKPSIKRLYLLLCTALVIWSFSYAFVYVSAGDHGFWIKLSALGWCFFAALVLHLVLVITDNPVVGSKAVLFCMYIPACVFFYMSVFLFWPGAEPSKRVSDFFYIGDFIYNFTYYLLGIVLVHLWGRRSDSARERKQSRIIVLSSIIPFMLNLVTQSILPAAGITILPNIGQLYSLIMIIGVYYATVKYKLFTISSKLVIDEILAEMMDLIFILSPEGKITRVNNSTELMLGYSQQELLEKPLSYVLHEKNIADEILRPAGYADIRHYNELHCVKKNGELVPVNLSSSPVVDPLLKDVLGIILVGQDITVAKELEKEITQNREVEEQLRMSEERFSAAFNNHSAVMYLIDADTLRIHAANEAAQKFYGYTEKEFTGIKITDINMITDEEECAYIKQVLAKEQDTYFLKQRLASGEIRDVEVHASPIPNSKKEMIFSIVHDITERKKAEKYITYLAYHDSVTGLPNRKYFYERLQREIEDYERHRQQFAVLYADLDDFKLINDSYGHETGDYLLCEISNRLNGCIGEADIVSRIGGDEFTLLVHGVHNEEAARTLLDNIVAAVESPVIRDGREMSVRVSIGMSIYPHDGRDVATLIKKSDNKMYMMKRHK